MKTLRTRNAIINTVFGALAVALVSVPAIGAEGDRTMERRLDTWGQRLQDKVAAELARDVNREIVLSYEHMLAQQATGLMEEIALVVSIQPDPVIYLEPGSMMANVDTAGIEDDCD